jgi:molybdopterin molybdotransferase
MVTVRLPDMLRKYAAGDRDIEVDAITVADALDAVVIAHPELQSRIFDEEGLVRGHLSVFSGDRLVARRETADVPVVTEVRILVAVAGGDDVRMRGFRDRATVDEALTAALDGVAALPPEDVGVTVCAGRVLAADVVGSVDVPPFRRATMDGYAVRAADTYGSSAYNPVPLDLIGESMPGRDPSVEVKPGQALRIMTGAPVPGGADAVLRAEDAEPTDGGVDVRAPVPEGRNVGRIGEDITAGTTVLTAGRRLLPADVGLLASIGHDPVSVHRRPRVRVVVSGNELLPPGERPSGALIVDSNSPMLAALVERDGGLIESIRRLPDGREPMRAALAEEGADVIITAGAVSVGREDYTPLLVAELGELAVHGVAMRPSSPTGVGRIGDAPVLLLPGNPVSCLVAYDFFAGPVIRTMAGLGSGWPYRVVTVPLAQRLVSQIGRTDYARVVLDDDKAVPLAVTGASVLSSVTRADGFVVVPAGLEGHPEGAEVEVHLYGETP